MNGYAEPAQAASRGAYEARGELVRVGTAASPRWGESYGTCPAQKLALCSQLHVWVLQAEHGEIGLAAKPNDHANSRLFWRERRNAYDPGANDPRRESPVRILRL